MSMSCFEMIFCRGLPFCFPKSNSLASIFSQSSKVTIGTPLPFSKAWRPSPPERPNAGWLVRTPLISSANMVSTCSLKPNNLGWLYIRVQEQRNSKIKRPIGWEQNLGPKEFTLGFRSKVPKKWNGANLANTFLSDFGGSHSKNYSYFWENYLQYWAIKVRK